MNRNMSVILMNKNGHMHSSHPMECIYKINADPECPPGCPA